MQSIAVNEISSESKKRMYPREVHADRRAFENLASAIRNETAAAERPEKMIIKSITGRQHETLVNLCKTGTASEVKIALNAYINMLEDLRAELLAQQ